MNWSGTDQHLTAKIVCEYVAHHKLATDLELLELITAVHQAIGQLGQPAKVEEARTPAVLVRDDVCNMTM